MQGNVENSSAKPIIVLFRNDMRLADNRALSAAVGTGSPVVCALVLDEVSTGVRALGGARRWWLHHSIAALQSQIAGLGGRLLLRRGPMLDAVADLQRRTKAASVFWNRRYAPAEAGVDAALKSHLSGIGVAAESFDGALLHEPTRLKTGVGGFYKVFGAFKRALDAQPEPRDPVDAPKKIAGWSGDLASDTLESWELLPRRPDWAGGLRKTWTPGEAAAHARLDTFIDGRLDGYADGRDFPDRDACSGLSPHLTHGEITPYQILARLRRVRARGVDTDIAKFRSELIWREFCYHLLFHFPDLHRKNFNQRFDAFPWRSDANGLQAWQSGQTGYPIIDAGMRELWETGVMHNRIRMAAASFLTKHLMIDWREGEKWFWDTLVDADPANNPANWQWVAGSGADAAPYFRIFNPVLQGEKFDPAGAYTRRYVPELANLDTKQLQKPWAAPHPVLTDAGVKLGRDYPVPVIDHKVARDRALAGYTNLRGHP